MTSFWREKKWIVWSLIFLTGSNIPLFLLFLCTAKSPKNTSPLFLNSLLLFSLSLSEVINLSPAHFYIVFLLSVFQSTSTLFFFIILSLSYLSLLQFQTLLFPSSLIFPAFLESSFPNSVQSLVAEARRLAQVEIGVYLPIYW